VVYRDESGFTMVELLVGVVLFAIASIGFYQVLFATARSADSSRAVTKVSEEARLGFGRMIRDTREGRVLVDTDATSTVNATFYKVEIDFDGDGAIESEGTTNSQGDYEVLTFAFNDGSNTVTLNGEVLMRRVQCVESSPGVCRPFFDFASNRLEYDWNNDGVTTWQELDDASTQGVVGVGNNNDILDDAELPFVSNVFFEVDVVERETSTEFIAEAQLRNLR
jgi:prepilin-type N-terminal cleavage/methylation domain-containing protein